MTTLSQLEVGQTAEVLEISGIDAVSMRLMELGMLPGVVIEMIGQAPLGDPVEVGLGSSRVSLRRSEADRVQISVLSS